jgi:hypothetical protein
MVALLIVLQVAREVDHLIPVLSNQRAFQRDDAGGIFVTDAVTGLT